MEGGEETEIGKGGKIREREEERKKDNETVQKEKQNKKKMNGKQNEV